MHYGPLSFPHNFQCSSPLNHILPRYLKSIRHVGEENWGALHLPVACVIVTGNKTRDETSRCPRSLNVPQTTARWHSPQSSSRFLSGELLWRSCEVLTKWPQGCLSLLVVMATIKASTIPPQSANAQAGNRPPIIKLLSWRKKSYQRYHFLQVTDSYVTY